MSEREFIRPADVQDPSGSISLLQTKMSTKEVVAVLSIAVTTYGAGFAAYQGVDKDLTHLKEDIVMPLQARTLKMQDTIISHTESNRKIIHEYQADSNAGTLVIQKEISQHDARILILERENKQLRERLARLEK